MEEYLKKIINSIENVKRLLLKDDILKKDMDLTLNFIPPYCKAARIEDVKLVVLGQDPTIRNKESRKYITATLNLDKDDSLRNYLELIANKLNVDLDQNVYATNLYKCFFKDPPADDERILYRHFKYWMDLLYREIRPFNKATTITLGEPLVRQLVHSGGKKVSYFWDYIGETTSGKDFKLIRSEDNYLNSAVYPFPHQPSWSQNQFYKKYFNEYLMFVKETSFIDAP